MKGCGAGIGYGKPQKKSYLFSAPATKRGVVAGPLLRKKNTKIPITTKLEEVRPQWSDH